MEKSVATVTLELKRARVGARLTLAALLFIADRGLKTAALGMPSRASIGPLDFNLFRNQGIAFSLPLPDLIFWPAALAIYGALAIMLMRAWRKKPVAFGAYGFIVFGATSNLWDRAWHGATIDYLIFFQRSAVNLADAMIVGGLLWLLKIRSTSTDSPAAGS